MPLSPPALSPSATDRQLLAALPLTAKILRAWARGCSEIGTIDPGHGPAAATLLAQNRMLGLTGDLLIQTVPTAPVIDIVQGFRRLTAQMNGAGLLSMRRLMTAMRGLTDPVVVYKGVVLQQHLYGTPFARPASDIDILTRPSAYNTVSSHLQRAGYDLDRHTDTLWWRWFLAEQQFRDSAGSQTVDLHHRLQQPGCPMPRRTERLIACASPTSFLGGEVLTFRDDHALLVAAMSVAKALHHREPAGRYVSDAERFLRRFSPEDWSRLDKEAIDMGLGRTLDLAVRCVDVVFATIPPGQRRDILPKVSDVALRDMVLAPGQARWIRRRELLRALCDKPSDAISAWMLMAASETARRASGAAPADEGTL